MPLITVKTKSVNDAWQIALARVLKFGDDIKTEYDKEGDPPSKDATVAIEITEPFDHPLLVRNRPMKIKSNAGKKWDVYGCDADTFLIAPIQSNYIEEILEGINDKYLRKSEKSFPYSYHDRIWHYKPFALEDTNTKLKIKKEDDTLHHDIPIHFSDEIKMHQKLLLSKDKDGKCIWNYRANDSIVLGDNENDKYLTSVRLNSTDFIIPIEFLSFPAYNQLDAIVKKLARSPYSRRCQFITWRPYSDQNNNDPPCLQRGFFRIVNGKLKFQTNWRSRDLFRAWEANVNGMLHLQKYLLEKINTELPIANKEREKMKKLPNEIAELGSYTDFSNSLHIYGENFKDLLDMMERLQKRKNIHPELEEQIEPLRIIVKKYFKSEK